MIENSTCRWYVDASWTTRSYGAQLYAESFGSAGLNGRRAATPSGLPPQWRLSRITCACRAT